MKDDGGRIVRNATYLLAGSMVADVAAFLFRLVVARGFGPDGFGLFSLALMTVTVGTSLALIGLPDGIVTFVSRYRGQGEENRIAGVLASSFAVAGAVSLGITAFLWVLAPTVATGLFDTPDLALILRTFVFGIPARVIVALTGAVCLGYEHGGRHSIVKRILPKLGTFGGAAAVVLVDGSLQDVVAAYVLVLWASALAGIVLAVLSVQGTGFDGVSTETRELLGFSVPLLFTGFIGFFLNWTDAALIGYFMDSGDVGIYQAAFVLGTNIAIFHGVITTALYPNLGSLVTDSDEEALQHRYVEAVKWITVLTLAPTAYLVAFPNMSIGLLFGDDFAAGADALVVLVVGQFFASELALSTEVLKATKNSRYIFRTYAGGLLVNVVLNVTLIPTIGIVGAAVGTIIARIVANALHYRWARRRFSIQLPYREGLKTAMSGLIAVGLTLPLRPYINSLPRFLGHIVLFSVVYVVGVVILGVVGVRDVRRFVLENVPRLK